MALLNRTHSSRTGPLPLKFHIAHLIPDPKLHGQQGYKEVIESLTWGLEQLGHQVTFAVNTTGAGILIFIVGSLGSAMYYLIRDKGQSDRTVKALTIRVVLSVALFAMLMIGHYLGLIPARSGL